MTTTSTSASAGGDRLNRRLAGGEVEYPWLKTEADLSQDLAKDEQAQRDLDLRLDSELKDTFPASDALKITRGTPEARHTPNTAKAPRSNAPSDR